MSSPFWIRQLGAYDVFFNLIRQHSGCIPNTIVAIGCGSALGLLITGACMQPFWKKPAGNRNHGEMSVRDIEYRIAME